MFYFKNLGRELSEFAPCLRNFVWFLVIWMYSLSCAWTPVVKDELDGVWRQEEGRAQSSQFLAANFNNGLFCMRINPCGSEQFDLGCAFQTS